MHASRRILGIAIIQLLLAGLAVVLPVQLYAAGGLHRYVATTGVDTGDCPQSAPCKTITYALSLFVPSTFPQGDAVILLPGTYVEAVHVTKSFIEIGGRGALVKGSESCGPDSPPAFTLFGQQVEIGGLTIGCGSESVLVIGGRTSFSRVTFDETTGIGISMAGGSVYVGDSLFTGATGICSRGPATAYLTVMASTFLTRDIGICVNQAQGDLSGNRIVGNRTAGVIVSEGGSYAGGNWWGCNAGPNHPGCDKLIGATARAWEQLALAYPAQRDLGMPPISLEAHLRVSGTNEDLCGFPPAPVRFGVSRGSVNPETSDVQDLCDELDQYVATYAFTQFTPPMEPGPVEIRATLDNQTVSGTMFIGTAPSPSAPIATSEPSAWPTLPPTSTLEKPDPTDRGVPLGLAFVGVALGLLLAATRRTRPSRSKGR